MKPFLLVIVALFSASAFANDFQYLVKIKVEQCDSTENGSSRRSILERSETVVRSSDLVKSPSDAFEFSELRKSIAGRSGALELYFMHMAGDAQVVRLELNYQGTRAPKKSAFLTLQTAVGATALGVAGRCKTKTDEGKLNLEVFISPITPQAQNEDTAVDARKMAALAAQIQAKAESVAKVVSVGETLCNVETGRGYYNETPRAPKSLAVDCIEIFPASSKDKAALLKLFPRMSVESLADDPDFKMMVTVGPAVIDVELH